MGSCGNGGIGGSLVDLSVVEWVMVGFDRVACGLLGLSGVIEEFG